MRPPRRRTSPAVSACGIALTLLTLLGGTACTQEKPAAPASATSAPALTARQAELLALTRFANYRRGTAQVTADIPVQGHPARLTGRIDWRHSTGLAILQGNGGVLEHGRHLLRWDRTTVSVQRNWPGPLPPHPPRDGWTQRALTATTSTIDTALLLLLNLAADRPDNAQLLLHSGARSLRHEEVGGVPVTVFAGPSTTTSQEPSPGTARTTSGHTRYWIDADGGLRRFSARLGGSTGWLVAQLSAAKQ
ncbi:hypothetical protein OG762_35705 [Streptomyces sp. NBC_01136]|uniref:hypothetical protein n=1 Tax=unclassified Streptomyces TaxID=2593676 RepID=UPI00324C5ED9|nr:hypothetical protein OG762_35705 [Streptomyces sp. NBC_01136]